MAVKDADVAGFQKDVEGLRNGVRRAHENEQIMNEMIVQLGDKIDGLAKEVANLKMDVERLKGKHADAGFGRY